MPCDTTAQSGGLFLLQYDKSSEVFRLLEPGWSKPPCRDTENDVLAVAPPWNERGLVVVELVRRCRLYEKDYKSTRW